MRRTLLCTTFMTLLLGAGGAYAQADASAGSAIPSSATAVQTQPTAEDAANNAVLILDPSDPARSVVAGSGELGGVELYGLDGKRVGAIPAGEAVAVDVRYNVALGATKATVLAVMDTRENRLRLFAWDAAARAARDIEARPLKFDFAGESLCLLNNPRDGALYAFLTGGDGEVAQWQLFATADGKMDARPIRTLRLPSEVSYCVADDATGDLYAAEQAIGVWRFDGDPEAEVVPEIIDVVKFGKITEEVGGLALYEGGDGARYLIASDASADRLSVYDRGADHKYLGSVALGAGEGAVQGAGGLFASSLPAGPAFPGGLLIAMDDVNTGGQNYKLASFAGLAQALNLNAGSPRDPRAERPRPIATVTAAVETTPVETAGDAADDPAIWVDPSDPARSLVIGTQKQSGLYVYDLSGKVVQFLPDGKMNNVDVRDGFRLGNRTVSLVTASNRTNDSISIYMVDPATRTLVNVADGVQPTGLTDPYGLCMYVSAKTKRTYVFISDGHDEGPVMRQWELIATRDGKVRAKPVRDFKFGAQAEGCVADDATGVLYVAEEDTALWRMGAEPSAGSARTAVATVKDNPKLKDDLEGVGLYDLGGGRGYLVLSSQGNNSYAVFRREGDNAYLGSFAVVADGASGIDGISETDGLEVTSRPLGPAFPNGAFVAQDGRNIGPAEHQNFKIVGWDAIARELKLESR